MRPQAIHKSTVCAPLATMDPGIVHTEGGIFQIAAPCTTKVALIPTMVLAGSENLAFLDPLLTGNSKSHSFKLKLSLVLYLIFVDHYYVKKFGIHDRLYDEHSEMNLPQNI